jgi:hypothetical protein
MSTMVARVPVAALVATTSISSITS